MSEKRKFYNANHCKTGTPYFGTEKMLKSVTLKIFVFFLNKSNLDFLSRLQILITGHFYEPVDLGKSFVT